MKIKENKNENVDNADVDAKLIPNSTQKTERSDGQKRVVYSEQMVIYLVLFSAVLNYNRDLKVEGQDDGYQ